MQIGTNTATPGDTVIGLMTSLLFMLYFSFLHLHTSYSPQAHLQSSHCIVTVYICTHNVLPASPGRAQEKVNNNNLHPCSLLDFSSSSGSRHHAQHTHSSSSSANGHPTVGHPSSCATPCRPLPFLWNPLSRGSVFPT